MTAIYIIGGLLLIILILLFVPVTIDVTYNNGLSEALLRYFFLSWSLVGKKSEEKEKEETTETEENREGWKLDDALKLIKDGLPVIIKAAKKAIGSVRITKCRIHFVVAQDEAADTAIRFGRIQSYLGGIYGALSKIVCVKDWHIEVDQDYIHGTSGESVQATLQVRVFLPTLLSAGIYFAFNGGKIFVQIKNKSKK